ncbi:hypothetical protein ACFLZX_06210 [Nanoarchaeota archaeon]
MIEQKISDEERKSFDHILGVTRGQAEELASEPLKYWITVRDRLDRLYGGKLSDGESMPTAVAEMVADQMWHVKQRIDWYERDSNP